ncbi:alpha/beta fold hydrolase [Actinoplanes sp. NPDC026619]|uniref:thioesterase II family protein n=1 Tax=Actinoplanes sp. NPDC026619 TaxID=3155798 RepID=UPI0033D631D1
MFNGWSLPEQLRAEIWAVQPPGRENRRTEQVFRRLDRLVPALADHLTPALDRPYALFGHSMGALLAFELCRELRRRNAPQPARLFVSAHRAPDLPRWRPRASTLPPGEFRARLTEMAGPSSVGRTDPELLDFLAPMIRADFELCETYRYLPQEPLTMPLTCFAAVDDPEVRVDEMLAWQRHTTEPYQVYPFTGGHLFVRDRAAEVLDCITADLAAQQAELSGGPA